MTWLVHCMPHVLSIQCVSSICCLINALCFLNALPVRHLPLSGVRPAAVDDRVHRSRAFIPASEGARVYRARTPCNIYLLSRDDFYEVLDTYPTLRTQIFQNLINIQRLSRGNLMSPPYRRSDSPTATPYHSSGHPVLVCPLPPADPCLRFSCLLPAWSVRIHRTSFSLDHATAFASRILLVCFGYIHFWCAKQ